MKKYSFPTLSEILKVKISTKYVWEERVRSQAIFVHLLEDAFGAKLNLQAFSFYPNRVYFGMPITAFPDYGKKARPLWQKIGDLFEQNRWAVYSAFCFANPDLRVPTKFSSFEELNFDYVEVLLSELVLMDLNHPSHGVGQEIGLSLFQPLIGFSQNPVSRMVKGRPGSLILKYETEGELLEILAKIAKRKSYRREPFYIKKCPAHSLKTVFKGKTCLNCLFKDKLHL
ncbi:MAG: hypothetical protein Q8N98_00265 [bacterium]|nr:hypothetical protein [bacterium]